MSYFSVCNEYYITGYAACFYFDNARRAVIRIVCAFGKNCAVGVYEDMVGKFISRCIYGKCSAVDYICCCRSRRCELKVINHSFYRNFFYSKSIIPGYYGIIIVLRNRVFKFFYYIRLINIKAAAGHLCCPNLPAYLVCGCGANLSYYSCRAVAVLEICRAWVTDSNTVSFRNKKAGFKRVRARIVICVCCFCRKSGNGHNTAHQRKCQPKCN